MSTYKERTEKLEAAKLNWQTEPTNPTAVTNFYRAFYTKLFPWLEDKVSRIKCPYTSRNLEDLSTGDNPDMPLYLPKKLSNEYGLIILGDLGPWRAITMHNIASSGLLIELGYNHIRNDQNISGWMSLESTVEAPYRNHTNVNGLSATQLKEEFASRGRVPLTLNAYVAGGLVSYHLHGEFFDTGEDRVFSGLLNSRKRGGNIVAAFNKNRDLEVNDYYDYRYKRFTTNKQTGARTAKLA